MPLSVCLSGARGRAVPRTHTHAYARRNQHKTTQAGLPNLRDVLFVGNPIHEGLSKEEAKIEVLRRLPQVKKVDGEIVTPADLEKARSGGSGGSEAGGGGAAASD